MGCGKLVFTLSLAVFLVHQYSSASPLEGLNENETGETPLTNTDPATELLDRLRKKWGKGKWGVGKWGKYRSQSNLEIPDLGIPSGSGAFDEENLKKIVHMIQQLKQDLSESGKTLQSDNKRLSELMKGKVTKSFALNTNGSLDERTFREDCIGEFTDVFRQQLNFLPQLSQMATNVLSTANYFLGCLQAGFSTTTSKCLQNLLGRIQEILNNTSQQDRRLVTSYGNAFSKLFNCLSQS